MRIMADGRAETRSARHPSGTAMTTRLIAALFALGVAPLAARADDEHPYKNAKVGDFVTYKMTVNVAGMNLDGTITQTVTAKTDKEVTVKASGKVGPQAVPETEQKIDLTKPFDPTKGAVQGAADAKVEKQKDGKETVKVGDKSYEATWTTYKVTAKANNMDVEADVKVWMAKGIPGGLLKMDTTSKFGQFEMKMSMTMDKSGNDKDK